MMSDWQSMTDTQIDREITKGDEDDDETEDDDEADEKADALSASLDQLLQHRRAQRAQDQARADRKRADTLAQERKSDQRRIERYLGPTLLQTLRPTFAPASPDSPRMHACFVVAGDTLHLSHDDEHRYDYYSPSVWSVSGPDHTVDLKLWAGEQDYEAEGRQDQILDAIDCYLQQRQHEHQQRQHEHQSPPAPPSPPPAPQRTCIGIWSDRFDAETDVLATGQRIRVIVDSGIEDGYSQTTSYEGTLQDRDEHYLLLTQQDTSSPQQQQQQLLLPTHVLRAVIPLPPRQDGPTSTPHTTNNNDARR